MGVLDDAIREHIELKRKHGANPSELDRQEQEALGPARREAAPPPGAEEAEAPEPLQAVPDSDDQEIDPGPAASDAFQEPATPDVPEFGVSEPASEVDDPGVPLEGPLAAEDEAFAPEALPPEQSGAEYLPEEPGSAPTEEAEDVLEETPEFLQETPEHDRLWFEQKPPRDFDFDDDDR